MTHSFHPKHVLVTGSAGIIGQLVSRSLLDRGHHVRGFDLQPTPNVSNSIVGNLGDKAAVFQAIEGIDTIVHLGAYPNDADFIDVLLEPNVVGLYYICQAAKELGVCRLVLASSVQTVTGYGWPFERMITVADGAKPTNHYAMTKVWAEQMGEMYARVHQLSVISVRIGWLPRNRVEAERLQASNFGSNVFFSHDDAQRFFTCCVEADEPQPGQAATLFAASRPQHHPRLDLEPSRMVIGYEPVDVWPQGLPFDVEGLG